MNHEPWWAYAAIAVFIVVILWDRSRMLKLCREEEERERNEAKEEEGRKR